MSVKIKCDLIWVKDAVVINKEFDKRNDKYVLKVCNVSDKAVEHLLKQFNIRCRNDKEGQGYYFRAKSTFPFKFVDIHDTEVQPGVIGNGSKAIITITGSYPHKFSNEWGNGAKVGSTVTITELVAPVTKENTDDAPFEEDTTL